MTERVKRPASQFYWGDWLRDTALRSCSLAARGLWIDMLALMHEGTPYGHLRVGDTLITTDRLARMVGEAPGRVRALLAELEAAGVFSRDEGRAIYSRRMVKDERIRNARAIGGAKSLANPNVPQPRGRAEGPQQGRNEGYPSPPSFGGSPAVASASASASATPPSPSPSAGDRQRQGSRCAELLHHVTTALPTDGARSDLADLLERVADQEPWLAEMRSSLDGVPGHHLLTAQQLAEALRDFRADRQTGDVSAPNLRHFRGFLETAARPRRVHPIEPQRVRRNGTTPSASPAPRSKLTTE